eukprot:CAMPEP_0167764360 /NCGR_PEP_ID=MMETSP0110_2-20121227/13981_1 /TAXON_ID=629695 /ORGANISM="Gymnochlora sp., Strain CCMP2014" /LENGTH=73 /DNA_ID=CAMNT_0007651739 /DNA_START=264 /DNA_END=485 /DNA_ORIENTATION=-
MSVLALHTARQREYREREITKYWNIGYDGDGSADEIGIPHDELGDIDLDSMGVEDDDAAENEDNNKFTVEIKE